jgi:hypothetical protein
MLLMSIFVFLLVENGNQALVSVFVVSWRQKIPELLFEFISVSRM